MESNSKEDAEHEATHQFLEIKLSLLLGQVGEQAQEDIHPIMDRLRNVSLEITLAECMNGCFALPRMPLSICDENPASVKGAENISSESTTNVVLAVVFLDMLQISRMVDNMHAKEWDRQFVRRAVPLVQGVPSFAAGGAICLELLKISGERPSLWTSNPFSIGGGRCPEPAVAVSPTDHCIVN